MAIQLAPGDALMIIDMQNDFLPGGSLEVPGASALIPVLNRYIAHFQQSRLPVIATRDWHPPDHCSFIEQGGPWPPHCVAGSAGAAFHVDLALPADTHIVSKATARDTDAYSGFSGTGLQESLQSLQIQRIFVGGVATEYCVRNTVTDALRLGYAVIVLEDAIQAINRQPGDSGQALDDMIAHGATLTQFQELAA
ncbi:MAG: nicotinamidase [Nitrosomonas sp.]|uniref:nicotinamidase n=1 Tax=Nitrosomonas sp. TaxID=42353 RepID=UPI001D518553|nr:nicotinamidase [Nitrosomonas sp.]MBX9895624.1 nicotinamidase [Nitrosomonas sp.]